MTYTDREMISNACTRYLRDAGQQPGYVVVHPTVSRYGGIFATPVGEVYLVPDPQCPTNAAIPYASLTWEELQKKDIQIMKHYGTVNVDEEIVKASEKTSETFVTPAPILKEGVAPFHTGLADERRVGLLKLIDRQAVLFSEAGPLTVKTQRQKLHALVEEYAGLGCECPDGCHPETDE
jgi:hypothetical protein